MLQQTIEDNLKTAQKAKQEVTISALRNVKAEIKNASIAKGEDLTDEEVLKVLAKKVKQHKDSIESFRSGNREDLTKHEEEQMKVLESYLPQQMSEDEVKALVVETIKEMNAKASDFGKVMKGVMTKAGGAVDGKLVSKQVKEQL
jgi:uncharacterized protein